MKNETANQITSEELKWALHSLLSDRRKSFDYTADALLDHYLIFKKTDKDETIDGYPIFKPETY